MRVLLDECVPRALRNDIPDHEVRTVGWAGVKNGELLRLAATTFDVLITVDRNLELQQSFKGVSLAVIVIHASSNDIIALRPLMPAVLGLIPQAKVRLKTTRRRHPHGSTVFTGWREYRQSVKL